jgi:hypothetical protein
MSQSIPSFNTLLNSWVVGPYLTQDQDLLSQNQVLGFRCRPRSEQPDQQRPNYSAVGPHRARASPDSSSPANG